MFVSTLKIFVTIWSNLLVLIIPKVPYTFKRICKKSVVIILGFVSFIYGYNPRTQSDIVILVRNNDCPIVINDTIFVLITELRNMVMKNTMFIFGKFHFLTISFYECFFTIFISIITHKILIIIMNMRVYL